MVDIQDIRMRRDEYKRSAHQKHCAVDIDRLLALADERITLQQQRDTWLHERNVLAKKGRTEKPTEEDIAHGRLLKERLGTLEEKLKTSAQEYQQLLLRVPTIPSADTPIGEDERDNVEVYKWGTPTIFSFPAKDHITLGRALDLLDCDRGVAVSGYRGYYLKNEAAMLQMALMMFGMQRMVQNGFTPFIPPTLVRGFALAGSGYFRSGFYNPDVDEIYKVTTHDRTKDETSTADDRFLVGTAEPSLLAYYSDMELTEDMLPLKLCGFSPCYRSEIGSYGKDTRGIYRVHEFMKIEQVIITRHDIAESERAQEEMIGHTRTLYEELALPFREIQMCTGDLGPGKYRQIDTEIWMPSREGYGEVGSASNFLDWQSRRLKIRYRDRDGKKQFVYMLNNTVLASARLLIAILENYQQADGSVKIPDILQPFMQGKTTITQKNPRL